MMQPTPIQYLEQELGWLNLLLQYETQRLRASYQLSLEEFRGLYISDDQVDAHLASMASQDDSNAKPHSLLVEAHGRRAVIREQRPPNNPLARLAHVLNLTELEQDILVLAAAVEYDLKYLSIFAYLNNDVAQRWPTADLAVRLFSRDRDNSVQEIRSLLRPHATLFSQGVFQTVEATRARPSWRAMGFQLTPIVWDFLIDAPPPTQLGSAVAVRCKVDRDWDTVFISKRTKAAITQCLPNEPGGHGAGPVFLLTGREGAGRQLAIEAICGGFSRPMMTIRADRLNLADPAIEELLATTALMSLLLGAVVFVQTNCNNPDSLCLFIERLKVNASAVFISCPPNAPQGIHRLVDRSIDFDTPQTTIRREAWQSMLSKRSINTDSATLDQLAEQFKLNTGEMTRAASGAVYLTPSNGSKHHFSPSETKTTSQALFESTRSVLRTDFGPMARRVVPKFGWDDIVLPHTTRRRLRSIAKAVEHRELVFEQWGFGGHRTTGNGLTVLFAGKSGTGKTICASVIAQHVGLDLYKIDLSGVVSKYIGETEKNLERIFSTAHAGNTILFFDEADALFGKRSEVKDAHDRFANIETGYLLQKLEEHSGVVILATNLANNIDDAFSRRIDFSIEFPMPDEKRREEMWRKMFPSKAPLDDDVQFDFLAKRFELSGGEIRNVATQAAFRAAQNGCVIRMKQIVESLDEQFVKQGKLRTAAQFGPYYDLVRAAHQKDEVSV